MHINFTHHYFLQELGATFISETNKVFTIEQAIAVVVIVTGSFFFYSATNHKLYN